MNNSDDENNSPVKSITLLIGFITGLVTAIGGLITVVHQVQLSPDLPPDSSSITKTKEIFFLPGSTSETISDVLNSNKKIYYFLEAQQNQLFQVKIQEGDIKAIIYSTDGTKLGELDSIESSWRHRLRSNGKVRVLVSPNEETEVSFILFFKID